MNILPRHSTTISKARAFTLLEIIVVVAIVAMLSAMILPRLTGNEQRAFKLAVDQVGDFLTMYAQRQTLGQKVVGIGRDEGGNALVLMEIDTGGGAGPSGRWRIDPTVKPVVFPYFMRTGDVDLLADGSAHDASEWPLSSQIGQERPTIQIDLRGAGETASVTLYPYGVAPVMASSFGTTGTVRTKIDLDSSGQSRTDW